MMSDVNKIKTKKLEKGITDFSGQRKLKPKPEIGKTGYQQNSKPTGGVGPQRPRELKVLVVSEDGYRVVLQQRGLVRN